MVYAVPVVGRAACIAKKKEYNKLMQKIATRIFIVASTAFGFFGVVMILSAPNNDADSSNFNIFMMKLLVATGFVVLSSFALSVAGKYLNGKS